MPRPLSRTLFRRERIPLWRRARTVIALVLLVAVALAAAFAWWTQQPLSLGKPSVEVYVPPGAGTRATLRALAKAGVPVNELPFLALARMSNNQGAIRTGVYEILDGLSPWRILQHLRRGRVLQSSLLIPEGWTFAQIRTRIDAHPDLAADGKSLDETALLASIGATEKHPEGLFFPDTYYFDKRSSAVDIYRRAYRQMQRRLEQAWASRSPGSPLKSPYDLLILASIVEKETGTDEDRPLVAAVFNNRLRLGMRLQTDPTVIYGLGERFDGNLRKKDLLEATPYNTYVINGLPPTPIAAPGASALLATVQPAASKALYFVARGDGSSEFSNTLAEHNRAVYRYQIARKIR